MTRNGCAGQGWITLLDASAQGLAELLEDLLALLKDVTRAVKRGEEP